LAEIVHHHILWLLVGSYVVAALAPGPGLWLRSVDLGRAFGTAAPHVSLPSALLSFLLFAAGLGVQPRRLWQLARRPTLLIVGVLANVILPLAFIQATATTMRLWHNPREVQEILVGLALIASMPVAGSSTAWVQNADGDLALSIGLVVLSTCLSPAATPSAGWPTASTRPPYTDWRPARSAASSSCTSYFRRWRASPGGSCSGMPGSAGSSPSSSWPPPQPC
jgi:BASS family bile acid:Na+ symporter